jgi:DNA-binding NarL/FixJ family response regulator
MPPLSAVTPNSLYIMLHPIVEPCANSRFCKVAGAHDGGDCQREFGSTRAGRQEFTRGADLTGVSTPAAFSADLAGPGSGTCAPKASPVRIVVVDDHDIVREALTALIDREEGMKVVGSAATGEEAVVAARNLRPDVMIMDLVLPRIDGIDATRRILEEFPHTHVVALSACHTPEQINRALCAGACGYVLKTTAGAELLCAIKAATTGNQYVSPAIAALLADRALRTAVPNSPFDSLSAREREVLRCIVAGCTSFEIAQRLSLSRKTVDTYRSRMMVKLGVANRAALIRVAMDYELPKL